MNSLVSILIVEDDAVIRAVLEMALAAEGFTKVSSCSRGDEGMDAARRKNRLAQGQREMSKRDLNDRIASVTAECRKTTEQAPLDPERRAQYLKQREYARRRIH